MPIQRIVVNAPAAPRTPTSATATADARWADVGIGNVASMGSEEVELLRTGWGTVVDGEVKNEVGRAIRTTPRSDMREAYCAERGKGSLRKR